MTRRTGAYLPAGQAGVVPYPADQLVANTGVNTHFEIDGAYPTDGPSPYRDCAGGQTAVIALIQQIGFRWVRNGAPGAQIGTGPNTSQAVSPSVGFANWVALLNQLAAAGIQELCLFDSPEQGSSIASFLTLLANYVASNPLPKLKGFEGINEPNSAQNGPIWPGNTPANGRTAWSSGSDYNAGDQVTYGGGNYICRQASRSGSNAPTTNNWGTNTWWYSPLASDSVRIATTLRTILTAAGQPSTPIGTWTPYSPANADQFQALPSGVFDFITGHQYTNGDQSAGFEDPGLGFANGWVSQNSSPGFAVANSGQMWITETGWVSGPAGASVMPDGYKSVAAIDETSAATYLTRAVLSAYFGNTPLAIYELLDEGQPRMVYLSGGVSQEGQWGVARYDLTLKNAGTAIQNLFALYNDPAGRPSLTPYPIAWSGLPSPRCWGLSQRSDGSYLVAVWNQAYTTDLGGQSAANWSSATNYTTGTYVRVAGTGTYDTGFTYVYKAVASSGPGNGGAVTPGTNSAVWAASWTAGTPNPPAATTATLTLARNATSVTAYRPVQGTAGTVLTGTGGVYSVPVYADPTILHIVP